MAAVQAEFSIAQDGDIITVTCKAGDKSHSVKLHKDSKPSHGAEHSFGEMSDEQIVAAEEASFADFLKGAGQ